MVKDLTDDEETSTKERFIPPEVSPYRDYRTKIAEFDERFCVERIKSDMRSSMAQENAFSVI